MAKSNVSSEGSARAIIQRLRPNAQKHNLGPTIVEVFIREQMPKEFRTATWEGMRSAPGYADIREEAEYRRPHFIPDLSEVYADDREIIAFEIEDRCPISRTKLKVIYDWLGVMNGWDEWHLLLLTTNGRGFGWEVLIDTKTSARESALRSLRDERYDWLQTYPHLNSEAAILRAFRWRNWRMPSRSEFQSVKRTMSFI